MPVVSRKGWIQSAKYALGEKKQKRLQQSSEVGTTEIAKGVRLNPKLDSMFLARMLLAVVSQNLHTQKGALW